MVFPVWTSAQTDLDTLFHATERNGITPTAWQAKVGPLVFGQQKVDEIWIGWMARTVDVDRPGSGSRQHVPE